MPETPVETHSAFDNATFYVWSRNLLRSIKIIETRKIRRYSFYFWACSLQCEVKMIENLKTWFCFDNATVVNYCNFLYLIKMNWNRKISFWHPNFYIWTIWIKTWKDPKIIQFLNLKELKPETTTTTHSAYERATFNIW